MKKVSQHRILSGIITILLVFGLVFGSLGMTSQADNVTYKKGASMNDLISIMQHYCFIAFDTIDMTGHQHGNVLADKMTGNGCEYTTRVPYGFTNDNYIRKFVNLSSGDIKIGYTGNNDNLYVGEGYTVTKNGKSYYIDGHKVVDSPNVYADTANEKYINLEELQDSFAAYNVQLASQKTDKNVSLSGRKITVDISSGAAYLNLDASGVNSLQNDMIVYFPKNSSSILVVNVDLAGGAWNRNVFKVFDGETLLTQYEKDVEKNVNRVYYNFYDSSQADEQYTGTLTMKGSGPGTVIAPNASVTLESTQCGVYITKNLTARSECHWSKSVNPVAPQGVIAPTATPKATPAPTATPKATPAPTATPKGTPAPTATPKGTPAPTATPKATPAPTATPKATEASIATTAPVVTPKAIEEKSEKTAEKGKGTLIITVKDEKNGKPVPNAKVVITDSKGITSSYTTDNNGKVTVKEIAAGTAKVVVTEVPEGYTVTTNREFSADVEENKVTETSTGSGQSQKEKAENSTEDEDTSSEDSNRDSETSDSSDTRETETKDGGKTQEPKTGDWYDEHIMIGLMLISVVGFWGFYYLNRRKEK